MFENIDQIDVHRMYWKNLILSLFVWVNTPNENILHVLIIQWPVLTINEEDEWRKNRCQRTQTELFVLLLFFFVNSHTICEFNSRVGLLLHGIYYMVYGFGKCKSGNFETAKTERAVCNFNSVFVFGFSFIGNHFVNTSNGSYICICVYENNDKDNKKTFAILSHTRSLHRNMYILQNRYFQRATHTKDMAIQWLCNQRYHSP